MSLLEFDVIKQYFSKITNTINDSAIPLAIGDDAAIVSLPDDKELVICTDTLNEGVHFPIETSAYNIAYKALMVNLSDIAAMGAEPKWFTLNVSLPSINKTWLESFSKGLADLSLKYKLNLIGGDTTCGPLSITITLAGHINKNKALTRASAKIGDKVYVSGCTGEAAYGLACLSDPHSTLPTSAEYFISRLNKPTARIELGLSLLGIANACIDVSDGLLADIAHIVEASHCGVQLYSENIPVPDMGDIKQARQYALTGGDDYELVFTVEEKKEQALNQLINETDLKITCIGEVVEEQELKLLDSSNNIINIDKLGYQHFS